MNSLGLIVGTGECNAHCPHCAGIPLRKFAPAQDGVLDEALLRKTLRDSWDAGARRISLSGSGEPTLSPKSVTRTLDIIGELGIDGIRFNQINLYTNGIRIGTDLEFCWHLDVWHAWA